jgi:NAD(P)-dependent dehydrogenase (short-subunit alcohol dehydrogenase family)
VNNVGTNIRKPSVEFSGAEFDAIFSTNLTAAFTLSQQFHPLLKASKAGVLLFNSSVAGACDVARMVLWRLCSTAGRSWLTRPAPPPHHQQQHRSTTSSRVTHSCVPRSLALPSTGGPTALFSGSLYAMTKAALNQLTKNLAVEWAPDGIRVCAVAPW